MDLGLIRSDQHRERADQHSGFGIDLLKCKTTYLPSVELGRRQKGLAFQFGPTL